MSILSQINEIITKRGSCYVVLIDPDKKNKDLIQSQVEAANSADVDFLFIGGSLMMDSNFSERVKQIKYFSKIPIILFPGNGMHLNPFYDAILFMSVISVSGVGPITASVAVGPVSIVPSSRVYSSSHTLAAPTRIPSTSPTAVSGMVVSMG